MRYSPNFKDPRIQNRCFHALGFTQGYFGESEKTMSVLFSEDYFGQHNKPIHKYLKSMLLTCTDGWYSKSQKTCMTYKMNPDGFRYIRYRLDNLNDTISYQSWLNKMNVLLDNTIIEEDNQPKTFIDESGTKLTIEDALVNLKSYHEPLFDGRFIRKIIDRRFRQQLLTGDFIYKHQSFRDWNPLQSTFKREIRQDILADYGYVHAYDIEACAPTLILQYARMLGFNKPVNAYETYLENKTMIRQYFSDNANIDIALVKECINATFNGAKMGCNDNFALYHVLNQDVDKIIAFRDDEIFQLLKKDINKVWQYIKACIGTCVDNFDIDFFTMMNRGSHKSFCSSKKWNLYFQLENIVMTSVRSYMRNHSIRYFNEHDGWTSINTIDINELKDHVYKQTGFNINIDYKFIMRSNNTYNVIDTDNTGNYIREDNMSTCVDMSALIPHSTALCSESSPSYCDSVGLSNNNNDNNIGSSLSSLNTHVDTFSDSVGQKREHKRLKNEDTDKMMLRKERNRRYYEKKKLQKINKVDSLTSINS